MAAIDLQPIPVRTGCNDRIGRLVLIDGQLVAILVRLDDEIHQADEGKWFLELAFGPLQGKETFENLDEAKEWIKERVAASSSRIGYFL
jgi:hypothetical protein